MPNEEVNPRMVSGAEACVRLPRYEDQNHGSKIFVQLFTDLWVVHQWSNA